MGDIKLPTWDEVLKEFESIGKVSFDVETPKPDGNPTLKAAADLMSGKQEENEKENSVTPYWKYFYVSPENPTTSSISLDSMTEAVYTQQSKPPKKKQSVQFVIGDNIGSGPMPTGGVFEHKKWEPNAPTLESMLEVMQAWFLSASSNEAKKLWDVITCLRGPDSPSERASQETDERESNYIARRRRKYNTVEIIRHCAFKKHVPGSARSHKGKEIILPKDTNKWDHFDGHCWKAAQALGLKVIHKDIDYFTEGEY